MIRKATLDDLPRIIEIFDFARNFMRENGNATQWSTSYPSEEIIIGDIEAGECYCIETDRVHAVFTLMGRNEPAYNKIYEGNWKEDGPYGALHRVASDGTLRGVVAQAVEYALTYHSAVRCDTHRDNYPMQGALTRAGFERRGIIYLADGSPRLAYERHRD